MKNLVHIDLYGNSISGLIPDTLGNLSSLQTLELGSNSISGPIPDSIGSLLSLLVMNLPSNSISGPLPDSLGRLLALEELDLSYNEINGTLPRSIGRLTQLQKLNIEHNLLMGLVTEDHFANLTSLVSLRGNANMLRLELMSDNWEPPFQLGILTLNSWSLGPKFPYWLQNQTNLSVLYLGSTEISDNIPSWFWSTFSGLNNYTDFGRDGYLRMPPRSKRSCSPRKMDGPMHSDRAMTGRRSISLERRPYDDGQSSRYEFFDHLDMKHDADYSPARNEFGYGYGSSRTALRGDMFEGRRFDTSMREISGQRLMVSGLYKSTGDVGSTLKPETSADLKSAPLSIGLGRPGKERILYPDVWDPYSFEKFTSMKLYGDKEKICLLQGILILIWQ
ncbi:hypothetical protein E3N88_12929 [Mikania micrantha]|uniref:Disease resistance R13L4/SHOC-2-like LRR domain-containing protein n=1 Tax=Mikania micrantha TaxID=192012 RepID=A0A5N6P726_9ASTR|nr:hypothetical protein E3N88_12929 [Mikania micrantha]